MALRDRNKSYWMDDGSKMAEHTKAPVQGPSVLLLLAYSAQRAEI